MPGVQHLACNITWQPRLVRHGAVPCRRQLPAPLSSSQMRGGPVPAPSLLPLPSLELLSAKQGGGSRAGPAGEGGTKGLPAGLPLCPERCLPEAHLAPAGLPRRWVPALRWALGGACRCLFPQRSAGGSAGCGSRRCGSRRCWQGCPRRRRAARAAGSLPNSTASEQLPARQS